MKFSRWFTLEEMTASQTAARQGIDNRPPDAALENLSRLCAALDTIRDAVKRPIIVSSGYRCPALNAAIGGALHSAHMDGRAADIVAPLFGPPPMLAGFIIGLGVDFDQLIIEFDAWVHFAIAEPGEVGRRIAWRQQ